MVPSDQSSNIQALVADDDISIRVMLTKVLEREGFVTEVARDGIEALELIRDRNYDLIFLDLMMPRVDGVGVLRYLRTHAPDALKCVIVMTAFQTIADEVLETPAVGRIIAKPFDIQSVVAEARALVHENRSSIGEHDGSPPNPNAD